MLPNAQLTLGYGFVLNLTVALGVREKNLRAENARRFFYAERHG